MSGISLEGGSISTFVMVGRSACGAPQRKETLGGVDGRMLHTL